MARNWMGVITGSLLALTATLAWAYAASALSVNVVGLAAPFVGAVVGGVAAVRLADREPVRLGLVIGAVFGAFIGLLVTIVTVGSSGASAPVLLFPVVLTVALAVTAGAVAKGVDWYRTRTGDGTADYDEGAGDDEDDDDGEGDGRVYAPGTAPASATDRE
jgi:hypothetical protein